MKRLPIGLSAVLLASALAVSPAVASQNRSSTGTFGFASQLRGTAGGGGAAPYGYLPLNAKGFAAAKAAANARAPGGNGRGKPGGGGGAPTIYTLPNVSPSFDGTYQTGLTPPDTTGSMGDGGTTDTSDDRYIEGINTKYAIYSRGGSLINSGSLSALTGISGGLFGYSLSDPQIMWDAGTKRFYYAAVYYDSLFLSDNGIAIGYSKTNAPNSSNDFCKYSMPYGDLLPDYPKLGDSRDFLLVGYNQFSNAASTYDGSAVWWLSKPPTGSSCAGPSDFKYGASNILRNSDATLNHDGSHTLAATPVPANLVDDSDSVNDGTGYVVANADLSSSTYSSGANFASVFTVTKDGSGNAVFSTAANVNVGSYSMPAQAVQKGSSLLIDTLDGRFEAAVAAVDSRLGGISIWTAHAVFGGAGSEERWYELSPTAKRQSGSATGSLYVWNGAVSPDRGSGLHGDSMAMSVSTSSSGAYPAIAVMWKKGSNSQTGLTTLVQANGPNVDFSCSSSTACRWGDYSGATPDPSGNGQVWLANQYNIASSDSSGTDWRTRVFALTPT
jgi:hypothetical protein